MLNKNKKIPPPRSAQNFLLWFLREDFAEDVLGDLDEKFYVTLVKTSFCCQIKLLVSGFKLPTPVCNSEIKTNIF
jgi:hypothetical protein